MIKDEITDTLYIVFDVIIFLAIVSFFVVMGKNTTDSTYRLARDQRQNTTIVQLEGEPEAYAGIPDGNITTYDGLLSGADVVGEILAMDPSVTIKVDGRSAGFAAAQLERYRTTADGKRRLLSLINGNENFLREYTITDDGTITEVNYIEQ